QLMSEWRRESILAWQRVVCREYVPLRCVSGASGDSMPKSFEFRTFWWKTQCVGVGRYWVSESYEASDDDIKAIIRTAGEAVERLGVTFPVIDVAQTAEGKWIVIECNDGQDFGYSGVHPMMMWRKVVQYAGQ
ncbi:MAG: ATP-grasp domain-containing protein, partial [Phycisphaerae bacterium]|nr:ATP-grasp domain-containing protein [Phycisphaerae bacterium]